MKKIICTIIKTMIFFVCWALLSSIIPIPDTKNPAIWRFGAEFVPFICIVGVSLAFWLIEKKKIQIISFYQPLKNFIVGISAGTVWVVFSFLIMLFCGLLKVENVNSVSVLWLWIFSAFINTIMQELLVRGYLYQMIKAKHNIIAATIVSTALFTFAHGGAFEAGLIPVLNICTMSLLMTVVLEYTQSLVAPIIMHFIWNTVGAIILGCVSLAEDYPHLLDVSFSGNILLSGGIYKMEGSIFVFTLNVILILFFLARMKKKKA